MLNKKLVLGSLAGATLLVGAAIMVPTAAEASVVQGTCVNCHTMHNSEEGNTNINGIGTQNNLLRVNGCAGCHTGGNNGTDGRDTANEGAPQVTDGTTPLGAGYFDGNQVKMHSVTDTLAGVVLSGVALGTSPGGSFAQAGFDCTDCHGAATGGHHSTHTPDSARTGTSAAGNSYRFLQAASGAGNYVSGTGNGNYAAGSAANSAYVGAGGTGITAFCADCHSLFHGTINTGGSSPFQRHPTDVDASVYTPAYAGTDKAVPVGDAGVSNDVMCISCHYAHGSAYADLLRFDYSAQIAGDAPATVGCESCHGAK